FFKKNEMNLLVGPGRAAVGTWYTYLASKAGMYYSNAGTASPHWLQAEQARWPSYDLAALYLLDGSSADIVRIEPVTPNTNTGFRITTKFTSNSTDPTLPAWWREVNETVYALRDNGLWRLSNSLARTTAAWKHDTIKNIEYVHRVDYPFNRGRAERAAAFVDSLTEIFGVPPIDQLSYYLFNTLDDAYATIGLESSVKYGPVAGMSQPINHLLFSGMPSLGEEYRHELAHMVFMPLMGNGTSTFISEGVPTFFGGTSGMDYPTAVRGLASWLREHPQVTLDSLMGPGYSNAQTYPAAAVVAEMINDVGGRHGLKLLFDSGRSATELREGLQRISRIGWSQFQQDWRARAFRYDKKQ
ncbi:MAG: hypothetical protein ABJB74_14820, partial [Gemmatimonas sp.]